MKKILFGLVLGIMLGAGSSVWAAGESIVQAVKAAVSLHFNGEEAVLPSEYEVLNYNGHVYVPLRYMAEQMGAVVSYDERSGSVSVLANKAEPLLHDPDYPGVYAGNLQVSEKNGRSVLTGLVLLDDASSGMKPEKMPYAFRGDLIFYNGQNEAIERAALSQRFNDLAGSGPFRIRRFEIPMQTGISGYARVKLVGGFFTFQGTNPDPGAYHPPLPEVTADGRKLPVAVGTYCWFACAEISLLGVTRGLPVEVVAPGSPIRVSFKGNNQPTHVLSYRLSTDGSMADMKLVEGGFAAPDQEGVYSYAVKSVWDGKESFGGDAYYGFVVKVKANPDVDTR